MRAGRIRRMAAVLAGVAVLAGGVCAVERVEECVPSNALFVLKFSDLSGHYARLTTSEPVQRVLASGALAEGAAKLREARDMIAPFEQQYDFTFKQLLNDLIGRECVLAGVPGKPPVFISRGYDVESLQAAVKKLEELAMAQNPNAPVPAPSIAYKGVTVYTGAGAKGNRYAVTDGVLIISEDEEAVHQVIDILRGDANPITEQRQFQLASEQMRQGALCNGYLDAAVLWPAATVLKSPQTYNVLPPKVRKPAVRYAMLKLGEMIPQMQYLVFTVGADEQFTARMVIAYRDGRIPQGLASFLPPKGSRLGILDLAPDDAVFAGARRVRHKALWDDMMATLHPVDPEGERRLRDQLQQVISMTGGLRTEEQFFAALGDEAAVFVLPSAGPEGIPGAAVGIALGEASPIPGALGSIMSAVAVLASADKKNVHTSTVMSDYQGVALRTIRIEAPGRAGTLSPTLVVVNNVLFVTTSEDVARRIVDTAARPVSVVTAEDGTPIGCARFAVHGLRDMLLMYHNQLVENAVRNEGKSLAKAKQDLAAMDALLSLLSTVEVGTVWYADRTELVLTARYGEGDVRSSEPPGAGTQPAAAP